MFPANRKQKLNRLRVQALCVIMLFVLLPVAAALEISGVAAQPVTSTGATISWTTDQPADSFVHYGTNPASLKMVGDAKATTSHSLQISGLLEAGDAAGNKAAASGSVFADAKKPTVDVKGIPAFVTENSYKLVLTVSEAVKYEIFVNNKSVSK